jgi:hypothetical protein
MHSFVLQERNLAISTNPPIVDMADKDHQTELIKVVPTTKAQIMQLLTNVPSHVFTVYHADQSCTYQVQVAPPLQPSSHRSALPKEKKSTTT